jgi:hypothetical protein
MDRSKTAFCEPRAVAGGEPPVFASARVEVAALLAYPRAGRLSGGSTGALPEVPRQRAAVYPGTTLEDASGGVLPSETRWSSWPRHVPRCPSF